AQSGEWVASWRNIAMALIDLNQSQPSCSADHRMEPMSKSGMALLICFLVGTSSLFAQKRLEAGVFLDYLNVSQTSTNNFGLGARFGYRVHHDVMLDGELAYDYGINFGEAYRNIVNGDIAAIENTSVGVMHGLFGPKLQPSGGGFRPFITLKGGF